MMASDWGIMWPSSKLNTGTKPCGLISKKSFARCSPRRNCLVMVVTSTPLRARAMRTRYEAELIG
jgi:hypothetical protein